MPNGAKDGPPTTRGNTYDPDRLPAHHIIKLTVNQLRDPKLAAYAMHLQDFGVSHISHALRISIDEAWGYIVEGINRND